MMERAACKNRYGSAAPIVKRRIGGQWLSDIKMARDRQKAPKCTVRVNELGWNDEYMGHADST